MFALKKFLAASVAGAVIIAGLPAPPAIAKGFDPCALSTGNYTIPAAEDGSITIRVGCKEEWPEFGYRAKPNDLITSLDFHGPDDDGVMAYLYNKIDRIWEEEEVTLGKAITMVGVSDRVPGLKPEYIPDVQGEPFFKNNGKSLVFIFRGEDLAKDDENIKEWKKVVLSLFEIVINAGGAAMCKTQGWDASWWGSGLCTTVTATLAKTITEVIGAAWEGKPKNATQIANLIGQSFAVGTFSGASSAAFTAWSNRVTAKAVERERIAFENINIGLDAETNVMLGNSRAALNLIDSTTDLRAELIDQIIKKRDSLPLPPLRVMAIGDSITAGVDTENGNLPGNGYRSTLRGALDSITGGGPVDFVGSQSSGDMADRQHEGYPGRRIDEIARFASCAVPSMRPNLIFLHAGTNDANQNYQIASAPLRLQDLITQMLQDSPGAVVVVAELIPTGKADMQPRLNVINAGLRAVVKELQAAGKSVVLANTSDLAVADGLQPDAHPNAVGYQKLGTDFARATMTAAGMQLLREPGTPPASSPACDVRDDGTALGDGWRALGVIAPGMQRPDNYDHTEIAEMNGDKRADYVQIRTDGSIRVAINTEDQPGHPTWQPWGGGTGVFNPTGSSLPTDDPRQIRLADVDGNGRDDFVYNMGPISKNILLWVWLNKSGDGGQQYWADMQPVRVPIENVNFDHIQFADVNGDNRDDLLRVGDTGMVHAYFNTGRGWEEKLSWAPGVNGASRQSLRFADVNNDNKADYLMAGYDGSVHAYLNKGGKDAGGFEEHKNFANASRYPSQLIQFKDISGDGKADYLIVYQEGAVRAWLNRGGNL